MSCKLRTYEVTPPGGYVYVQHTGIHRKFTSVPMIEDQAQSVAAFRQANGLPRATPLEALQDIDRFTCARLGCMKSWCVDTEVRTVALAQSHPIVTGPCKGCGAVIT